MTQATQSASRERWRARARVGRSSLVALALLALVYPTAALAQDPEGAAAELLPPTLVQSVEPQYPEAKRVSGETASVVLSLELDQVGRVVTASVAESAGPDFDESALAAAKGLVFEPATKDGVPVPARIAFRFEFQLAAAPEPEPAGAASELETPPASPPSAANAPADVADPESDATGQEPAAIDAIDIEVEGERPPREPTTRILKVEEITKSPGTNGDALRAVTNLPGVARPPGLSGELCIRGSAPRDTRVFVDGLPIPIAYHFGGISSVVPSEALESIEMYPGNFGPQYGKALGGIIEAKLRSPRSDRWGGLLQVDLLDARMLAEGPVGSSTRVLVGARRSWVDAWLGPVLRSSGAGVTAAPVYYDYQALVEHDLTDDTTLRISLLGSDDRMALTMSTPSSDDPASGGDLSISERNARLGASAETRFGSDATWQNSVSVGEELEDFGMGTVGFEASVLAVNARSDFRARLIDGVTAVVGADFAWHYYDITLVAPAMNYETGESSGPIFGRPHNELDAIGQLTEPAAYAMLELQPVSQVKVLPGVRADYATDTEQWTVDPRLGLRYDLIPGPYRTTLKGGIGLFHQPPAPYETIKPFGTPGVHASSAIHYSAGIEQLVAQDFEVSVEGFYKDLRDLVESVAAAEDSASGLAYRNVGRGRSYGTETMLRYSGDGAFFGWLAYTLSRSERSPGTGLPMERYRYDQTHILTALGSYRLGAGWQLGGRFRYVTGSPYTPNVGGVMDYDAGAYAPVEGNAYSARLPAFHQLDVRVDKTWDFDAWKLTAYLDVQNAYNRKNVESVSDNYDYSQTSSVSGLPILPVLGVRGEI